MSAPAIVRIEGVTKRFGSVVAVDDVSLEIRPNEFFALLGPSGCGKTTLLRMLAGFERPSAGRIVIDGEDMAQVPPNRRPVNMVFQSYAVFPHMSVAENVAYGLRVTGAPRAEIGPRVKNALAMVRLSGLDERAPDQLSGGQRQRVALASRADQAPQGAAAGRAALGARQEAARGDAAGAGAPAAGRRHHLRDRHPRPGRGAVHGRSHRGHGPGADPADRAAGRAVRGAELPHGRRLHRHHEPVPGARARRRQSRDPPGGPGHRRVRAAGGGAGRGRGRGRGAAREGAAQPRASGFGADRGARHGRPGRVLRRLQPRRGRDRAATCASPATTPIAAGAIRTRSPRASPAGWRGTRPTASC